MRFLIPLITCTMLLSCGEVSKQASNDKDNTYSLLLLGTFHFNNPGKDVAKTKSFDILSDNAQLELEEITAKLAEFKPTKIFVEWPYEEQNELDSLYDLFLKGTYFKNESLNNFYRTNEIFQLAFRLAKKSKLDRLYGMDFNDTEFPFDSVISVMENNNQHDLKLELDALIEDVTTETDSMINAGASIQELLYAGNTEEDRNKNLSFYTGVLSRAGERDNFSGAYLASEWYRRNIYMWSLVQKELKGNNERIVVLLGAGHTAILNQIVSSDPKFDIVEFKDIVK